MQASSPDQFILDPRLEQSSFFVCDLHLSTVRLKSDKAFPWLYLVPKIHGIREIFDLRLADQTQLMHEVAAAGRVLTRLYNPAKINTAAYGNMVPQLHVHVFARFENDRAWPKPVWVVPADEIPYNDGEKNAEIQKLNDCFAAIRNEGAPI